MDQISKEARSKNMAAIKSKNTKLELKVRQYLYSRGFRYRVNYKIKGKPDIVFVKKKIAVFIHGCFWHQHGCKLSTLPKTKTDFWRDKLNTNKQRDLEVNLLLKNEGWRVFEIWECEIESGQNVLNNLAKQLLS